MSTDPSQPNTSLGELLLAAGYLDDDTLFEAKCLSSALNVPLLRVLSMGQLVPHDVLQAAHELESGLRGGFISLEDVERALKSLTPAAPPAPASSVPAGEPPQAAPEAHHSVPFDKPTAPPPTVWEFLDLAEVAERKDDLASFFLTEDTMRLVDVVASKYELTLQQASLALTCYQQISLGKLSVDDAVYSFNYCSEQLNRSSNPIDAAEQLGFRSGIWAIYDAICGH